MHIMLPTANPLPRSRESRVNQSLSELIIANCQHVLERHLNSPLLQCLMPRPDSPLQAEGEVVRELGELDGGVPPHAVGEEPELGREVGLDPVGEDGRGAPEDGADGRVWHPRGVAEEEDLGEEGSVDGEGEEQRGGEREGPPAERHAAAEEAERRAERPRDGRGEEARGPDDRGAEERGRQRRVGGEEPEVLAGWGGEQRRERRVDAGGVARGEAVREEEGEGAAELRQRRGPERWVEGEERERVEVELRGEEVELAAELHASAAARGRGWGGGGGGGGGRRREARGGEHRGGAWRISVWVFRGGRKTTEGRKRYPLLVGAGVASVTGREPPVHAMDGPDRMLTVSHTRPTRTHQPDSHDTS